MRKRVGMGGTYSTRVQRGGRFYCFSILLLTVFLAACAGPQPTTAITATSTAETAELIFPPTPTPRASPPTLAPTATLVPQPMLEPTLTPEPTRDIVNWQVLQTAQAPTEEPTLEPTATPIPEPYSHITLAPDGSALQEYLDTSGARVEPAIHLGEGAFELVPAGEVLPTHLYEPEIGWYEVDRDKALIEADTSTWFTATGSPGTLYEGLEMPMRVTTTDIPTLRGIEYPAEVQEYFMVNWLRMSHVAHTQQNRGSGEVVDFETYVDMVKARDEKAQIYLYKYQLNPDGTRGGLRQQRVDPGKGVTIQTVYDRTFEHHPLATVTNPNNAQPGIAFRLGATEAGQAAVAINIDADLFDAAISEKDRRDRLTGVAVLGPFNGMMWVAMYATSHAMQRPDANSAGFTLIGKDVNEAVDAAAEYSQNQLGIKWEYPYRDLISVSYD